MSDDYEVGYKKPPKHTRFRKGRSGNPKGRPKGTKSDWASFHVVFRERVTLQEGGRRRRVPAPQALAMRLLEKALKGNMTAMKMIVDLMPPDRFPKEAGTGAPMTIKDDSVREKLARRINRLAAAHAREKAEAERNGPASKDPSGQWNQTQAGADEVEQ